MSETTTETLVEEPLIEDIPQLERTLREMGQLDDEIGRIEAEAKAAQAEIEKKYNFAAMQDEIGVVLAAAAKKIDRRKEKYAGMETLATIFAQDHKDELLARADGKKTVKLRHGDIAYRDGVPSVILTDKEDAVIERLKRFGFSGYVQVKESVAKAKVKADPHICEAVDGLEIDPGRETIKITPRSQAA